MPFARRAAYVSFGLVLLAAVAASANFEQPTIKDTDYPVPSGALFVAPIGSDTNSGAEQAPFATIGHAVQVAASGDTIVVRDGVYREALGYIDKRLTIQPYPHETVWIKGSVVVTAWTPMGGTWQHSGWTVEFAQDTYDPGAFQPQYPHAGLPDMVFVDGEPLAQVGDARDVVAGTFHVDYRNDEITIGTDPTGRVVEVAAEEQALVIGGGGDGSIIRGLGFLHFGGHRFAGQIQADGARVTFENNTSAWGASKGLTVYNAGGVVRGNTFLYNGQMGMGAWRCDDLVIEGNRFAGNNQEHFVLHGAVAEASGAKITVTRQLVVRDNVIEDNLATGFWMDISIYDATIANNISRRNESYGFFFEISANALFAGNIVVGNADGGIGVSNSSDVRVINNTLVDDTSPLAVFDDSRVNGDAAEIALGITYITEDVHLKNNIISNGDGSQEALLFVRDYNSTPLKNAADMLGSVDYNGWYRRDSTVPADLTEWWDGTQWRSHSTVDAFRAATGFEPNGFGIDDVAASPFFVDEAVGDYNLRVGSPAIGAGEPVSADVAAIIGVATGVPVDIGALQFVPPPPEPPWPVPDGSALTRPLLAFSEGPGRLRVEWDDRCQPDRANLLHGDLADVSSLAVVGSLCDVGNPITWDPAPAGNLWFLLVGDDGIDVESSWGHGTFGERNGTSPSGACGSATKDVTRDCQ